MNDKRFHYRPFSRAIYDSSTGYLHTDLDDITDMLNELNDQADKNAELSLKFEMMEKKVDNLMCRKVMKKYGINSVEKLDQVLFNQKVW